MIKLKRTGSRPVEISKQDFWNAVGREVERHFSETRLKQVLTVNTGKNENEYRIIPNAHKNRKEML
jgi:hypothetical protein